MLGCVVVIDTTTGVKLFLGAKVHAYFVLKFALQRGEGKKREGVQILKQGTQNLSSKKYLNPCTSATIRRTLYYRQYA